MMFDNVGYERAAIILVFAAAFTIIGTMAPVVYATYVPNSEIMETHSFVAQNATVDDSQHYVCLDRTVHQATTAEAFTELYIVGGEQDVLIEVNPDVVQRYLDQGRTQVVTLIDLPENLQPGEYQYLLVVQIDMADGRVERSMAFRSETFTVSDGPINQTSPNQLC